MAGCFAPSRRLEPAEGIGQIVRVLKRRRVISKSTAARLLRLDVAFNVTRNMHAQKADVTFSTDEGGSDQSGAAPGHGAVEGRGLHRHGLFRSWRWRLRPDLHEPKPDGDDDEAADCTIASMFGPGR